MESKSKKFRDAKNRRFGVGDAGFWRKTKSKKIRYGKICRKRVLVGLRRGLLWFVIGDVVGYWLCLGFNRVYLGTRD